MNQSEFWNALDQVYGPTLGRSLVRDLYIPSLSATAFDALEAGVKPDLVWEQLVSETGAGDDARWVHRRPKRRTAS